MGCAKQVEPAFSNSGLEVVVTVGVTGVPRNIQLLHLSHDEVVVVVGGHIGIYYPHDAPKGRIVTKDEKVWIMYKNLIN